MKHTMTVAMLLAAAVGAGCEPVRTGASPRAPRREPASRPVATTAPAPGGDDTGEVMAYVNGKPIPMKRLNDLLLRTHGEALAMQLVASEFVRQAAEAEGVTVTEADVKAERDHTLRQLFGEIDDPTQLEALLTQMLSQRKYSRLQWDLTIRRNAALSKIASRRVVISDEQLREEFGEKYGRKYVIRHIQVESATLAQRVKRLAEAKGADFAALARKYSKNASARSGGLLPPIGTRASGLPPAIGQTARAMTAVGEISSPVKVATTFHILRLERIIEPKDVKFADVREKLAESVRRRQIRFRKQQIGNELFRKAKIVYVNPVLKAMVAKGPKR